MKFVAVSTPVLSFAMAFAFVTAGTKESDVHESQVKSLTELFERKLQESPDTSACATCIFTLLAAQQCMEANPDAVCDINTCFKDGDKFDLYQMISCCDSCNNEIIDVLDCFSPCLPECVMATSDAYGNCMLENKDTCFDKCVAVLDDLSANPPAIETASPIPTCDEIATIYSENACKAGIAGCCPACSTEFDKVADCMINEFGMPLLMQPSCSTLSCSDEK